MHRNGRIIESTTAPVEVVVPPDPPILNPMDAPSLARESALIDPC
jgi:hypothetical protein